MFKFLGAHPEVYPSPDNEPYFFCSPAETARTAEYLELFRGAHGERWLLEASPDYLAHPEAARRIRDLSPEARAIVMIRNPVDLIQSLHNYLCFVRREPLHSLADALQRDDALLDVGGRPPAFRYRTLARCGQQLARLLTVFPREHTHVIVYDDFAADTALEYRRTLEFLEIDTAFKPRFRVVNAAARPRSNAVQRLLLSASGRPGTLIRTVCRAVPPSVRHATWHLALELNRQTKPLKPLDSDLRAELWEEMDDDVALLEQITGRRLREQWSPGTD
jgi:hypothetical protein